MGSLAWPSNQAAPHLQCSVSLGQGTINEGSTVKDLVEANKTVSSATANSDACPMFPKICDGLGEVTFICMTDAAWAVIRDGSSQGGCLILAAHRSALVGETVRHAVVDWRSWKSPRAS
eukprot:9466926-Pyramimonas_sp.AAC.1